VLRSQGYTEQTSTELAQILSFLKIMAKTVQLPSPSAPALPAPSQSQQPVVITPNQMTVLHAQVQALQYLTRGQPVPPQIQQIIYVPDNAESTAKDPAVAKDEAELKTETNGTLDSGESKESDSNEDTLKFPEGRLLELDTSSPIYPYSAFTNPLSITAKALRDGRMHKVIIPTLMPSGLDPIQIKAERDRFIEARIAHRIEELSSLPGGISDASFDPLVPMTNDKQGQPTSSAKLRALIELKALKLRDKQRAMRSSIVNRMQEASSLAIDRKVFRRTRKPVLKDARQTEGLERQQRSERERRAKQKHLDYLNVICDHGQALLAAGRANQSRAQRLGKAVLKLHVETEKEEQKRIERISKERLKALKADDEEAYMKLIDTAKDTRITHLLRQTDSYLDSLSQAVRAQQNDDIHRHGAFDHSAFDSEDGPTDETTFGATRPEDEDPEQRSGKVDYYGVAHRISEKIAMQPRLLVGGQLKEYQLKGLQWMVSLYNNRLNGILADEMVEILFFCNMR
jgi:ATP-dependent helicase STH1/SNF2